MEYVLINSVDIGIFTKLYNECKDSFESGTYAWHLQPEMTEEQKLMHIYNCCVNILSAPNSLGWVLYKDSVPILMALGEKQDTTFVYKMGIVGKDINGSKSWLYSPENKTAREAFWVENNILEYVVPVYNTNDSIKNHINSRMAHDGPEYKLDVQTGSNIHNNLIVTIPLQ